MAKRKLLMVVDPTPECHKALRFAARRAEHTGSEVTMLTVIEAEEFEHWMAVREVMRTENRERAEEYLKELAEQVQEFSGVRPDIVIREGKKAEEVLSLIAEDKEIRILVLGASEAAEGPGPLVNELVNKRGGGLSIPVVVVPGHMSEEEIDLSA